MSFAYGRFLIEEQGECGRRHKISRKRHPAFFIAEQDRYFGHVIGECFELILRCFS